jgi:hypothetical protein
LYHWPAATDGGGKDGVPWMESCGIRSKLPTTTLQSKEILITSAKRLLQQNLPGADICGAAKFATYSITSSPPLPQQVERLRREHDIAALAALRLLDANDPLRAVDMLDLQPDHLAGAQAAAIVVCSPAASVPRTSRAPVRLDAQQEAAASAALR